MLDSIQPPTSPSPIPQTKKNRFRLWLALIMLLLLATGIFIGSKVVLLAQKIFDQSGVTFSFRKLFLGGDKTLIGEERGEIRFLLLGIGGASHDGGTLTDTMILGTLKLSDAKNEQTKVSLVAIPRDLVVYIPGFDYRKINSAYAFGEIGGKKQGAQLAIQSVERVIGKSIPYYALVDFEGFKKIIEDLGRIEINIEREFTDSLYPDSQGGYLAPLTFKAGPMKMDGDTALKFVRSRHGTNNEGTDFARSRRQQKVLKAIKEKVFTLKVLTNFNLINRLLDDFADHLRTNIQPHELKRLYELTRELPSENVLAIAIDVESGLLCNQIDEETGAYILVPCGGLTNYEGIRSLFKNQFLLSGLEKETPNIEIQNATTVDFLARRVEQFLRMPHLQILSATFRGQTQYQESIIYDNSQGQKNQTLQYLKEKLGIRVASSPFPFPTASENPDFVIIVTPDLEGLVP